MHLLSSINRAILVSLFIFIFQLSYSQTIEDIIIEGPNLITVLNDNNFPGSSGRNKTLADDNEVIHKEYLGVGDCREELIQQLMEDIPSEGKIFAYNAKGAEALRLQELAVAFPQYEDVINSWINRMEDLSIPFEMGMLYDVRMRGMYSLKVLNKMIHPEHTYQELKVSHGLEAVQIHRMLEHENGEEKIIEYRKQLLEYCAMDTSELLAVYKWLKQLIV